MEFVHHSYQPGDTIAAIATPPGEGGVAIVRITGNQAISIGAKIFSGPVHQYKSHTLHYGHVLNEVGEKVDDALLVVMKGKRSYCGEDTVEIHCHGGSLICRRVLEVALKAGARAAFPGEFTFKAFINGKIDLAQAEAVQELIGAKNEYALNVAEMQLTGALSTKISSFQNKLFTIAAILEAWVDFPEEGLEFASMEDVSRDLEEISLEMQKLVDTFHDGKMLHEGLSLCLVGCPNVGKSSLMNALLDKNRAIVSSIPGTTRDILEDHFKLSGLNIKLMDTAGIRETSEMIEQEGIKRSKEAMEQADLILLILDAAKGIEEEDKLLIQQAIPSKSIAVWNKMDISQKNPPALDFPHVVQISAKEKTGLDLLRSKIDEIIWKKGPPSREEITITNVRHKEALSNSIQACHNVIRGLQNGTSPEFLTIDMRLCLSELGKIIGTNITEDILSAIFSKFCIGK